MPWRSRPPTASCRSPRRWAIARSGSRRGRAPTSRASSCGCWRRPKPSQPSFAPRVVATCRSKEPCCGSAMPSAASTRWLAARHVSDRRGEARFVAPDGAMIEAVHPEHGRGRALLDDRARAAGRMTIRLRTDPPRSMCGDRRIAGRVLTTDGDAVPGALVIATFELRPGTSDAELHHRSKPRAVATVASSSSAPTREAIV